MLLFSQAKINIGLTILNKRSDGYHNLETIFYPIPWQDAIEIFESDTFDLHTYGLDLNIPKESHLIYKTWQFLKEHFDHLRGKEVEVHHLKHIPHGAGLGGGSGNVATFIKGINVLFNCNWSDKKMEDIASRIGSDCALFIKEQAAIGKGRGELLENIDLDLSPYTLQIFTPSIQINTGDAFKKLHEFRSKKPSLNFNYHDILDLPIEDWKHHIKNDFLALYQDSYPLISKDIELLYEEGALFADLSGSGPSFYGIFEKGKHSENPHLKALTQMVI